MRKLLEGAVRFRKEDFEQHCQLFENLKKQQAPHTLFITCSDSRIDPNMITKALPGELFIVRNIANIIPPFGKTFECLATTSAIEYAVNILEVENVIVCGHSNCGGCASYCKKEVSTEESGNIRKWLELLKPVYDNLKKEKDECDPAAFEWMMEQGNVVQQIKNLLTFPCVRKRAEQGKLAISGWYYIIETGEVFVYNKEEEAFILVESSKE